MHKRLIGEGIVLLVRSFRWSLLGATSQPVGCRERNMENLQIFGLDPYSVRCNPAMPKGKLIFAVFTLLQIKLDSHICPYMEYAGIKSQKPVGGKNEGWWGRVLGLNSCHLFPEWEFPHVCAGPSKSPCEDHFLLFQKRRFGRTGMAFSKSCIQPVVKPGRSVSRVYNWYPLSLAQGTVRKETVDSKYRILSKLRNCDFGKYSSRGHKVRGLQGQAWVGNE